MLSPFPSAPGSTRLWGCSWVSILELHPWGGEAAWLGALCPRGPLAALLHVVICQKRRPRHSTASTDLFSSVCILAQWLRVEGQCWVCPGIRSRWGHLWRQMSAQEQVTSIVCTRRSPRALPLGMGVHSSALPYSTIHSLSGFWKLKTSIPSPGAGGVQGDGAGSREIW